MAKRKTTEELGGEKVVRRSMRVKTEKVDGEVEARELDAEVKPKPVKAKKAGVKKGSPIKDEETEGDRKEEKVWIIYSFVVGVYFCRGSVWFHAT